MTSTTVSTPIDGEPRPYNHDDPRADLQLAVVLGSRRPGGKGRSVADWIIANTESRGPRYKLVDLADHPLPHVGEPQPGSSGRQVQAVQQRWSATIASYDGFVIVSPEHNHSIPGVLKTALDSLYQEWNNKAAALVTYGGAAGGARAGEHLRGTLSELQVAHVRQQLLFSAFHDFPDHRFQPSASHEQALFTMLDQLEAWTGALKPLRTQERHTT